MGFLQFLRILWARRTIIIVATLGSLVAAVLVTSLLPPRYEAKSRLMLDIVKPDPVTGEMIASTNARAYVQTQTELIKDYRVAGKVVDAFGWTSSPQLSAQYAARSSSDQRDFRRWLAQIVIDNTNARLIEGSNILEISFSATSADAARQGADAIRQAYIDQTLAFRREGASRNATWFNEQADKLRGELAAAEKRKNDFERENNIVLTSNNSDAEMVRLDALSQSAPAQQAAMAAAPVVSSPSTAALAQIDAQIATMAGQLGPNHPQLVAMRQQRAAVAQTAAQELAAARAAQRGGASGPSIGSMVSEQTRKVLERSGKVGEAQRLAADVSVLRDQFNKTLQRAAELNQEAQSTEVGLTLLGSAVAPERPVFPNVPLILIGATGLGFALGLLTALIVELLSRRVRGIEDLALDGIPTIGVMARATPATNAGLLARIFPGRPSSARAT